MRHTRRTVMKRAQREYVQLDRLVRRLRPADWRRRVPRPPTRDPWTVKDALAHIVYWKEHTARVIRGEPRLPEMRGLDVNQINRLIYRRWRRRSAREVVAWHRRVHAEVRRTLGRTPVAWFGRRRHGPEWPADLDGHSAAHRVKDIEAALVGAMRPRRARPLDPVWPAWENSQRAREVAARSTFPGLVPPGRRGRRRGADPSRARHLAVAVEVGRP